MTHSLFTYFRILRTVNVSALYQVLLFFLSYLAFSQEFFWIFRKILIFLFLITIISRNNRLGQKYLIFFLFMIHNQWSFWWFKKEWSTWLTSIKRFFVILMNQTDQIHQLSLNLLLISLFDTFLITLLFWDFQQRWFTMFKNLCILMKWWSRAF